MIKKIKSLFCSLSILLSSCTGHIVHFSSCEPISLHSKIAVIPFANNTETPLAGERAMSITAAIMESRGMCNLAIYHNQSEEKVLFPGMGKVESQHKLLKWARRIHAKYVMTGSVNEWTYKVGLDGEPVVGLAMQLLDPASGRVIWTSVGSLSGGSRIAVSTTAQQLANSMLNGLFNSKQMKVVPKKINTDQLNRKDSRLK